MSFRRADAILLATAVFAIAAAFVAPFLGEAIDFSSDDGRFIFFRLRLPRALLGLACGAGLAAAGVVLQALLKNPLATPYTLGVASGAAFGVVLAVVLGLEGVLSASIGAYAGKPLVGMAGAVLVIGLTYRAARVRGRLPTHTLLLAGVALTYLFSALILAVQYTATPSDAARILRWLVGSLEAGVDYVPAALVGGATLLGLAALLPLGRAFNAMAGGDEAALGVGVDVRRVIRRGYVVASLMVGFIVAFAGPIGFIGLLVPHTLRLLGLVDNRRLLPAAALAGGGFLALCDGATNLLPQQLPVGILTHLLGGPFFLLLLLREKRRGY